LLDTNDRRRGRLHAEAGSETRPRDAAEAADVVRAFKGSALPVEALRGFLANPANYLLVAESDGESAGFLTAYRLERPDREEGMFEAFVLTNHDHEAALRLYESTGGVVEEDSAVLFVYPMGTS
jgi:hypothetical protein